MDVIKEDSLVERCKYDEMVLSIYTKCCISDNACTIVG